MRAFILVCLFAAALAAPQGYNYQQQPAAVAQESQRFLQEAIHNTKLMQSLLSGPSSSGGAQSYYQRPQVLQQQQSSGFNIAPQIGFGQQQYAQAYNRPSAPVVTKDIFVHVAPDEHEERYAPAPLPLAPPRKHYRIVFIKAPAPKVSAAALRVNQAPVEEKTIIYVLTKKADPIDLSSALQEVAPKPPAKPEVYFIKYKTQEEAAHAQRSIQAQYDQLGGTTQVSDEGVAPVTSVIGAFDQHSGSSGGAAVSSGLSTSSDASGSNIAATGSGVSGDVSGGVSGGAAGSTVSKYLPPIVRI